MQSDLRGRRQDAEQQADQHVGTGIRPRGADTKPSYLRVRQKQYRHFDLDGGVVINHECCTQSYVYKYTRMRALIHTAHLHIRLRLFQFTSKQYLLLRLGDSFISLFERPRDRLSRWRQGCLSFVHSASFLSGSLTAKLLST